MIAEAIVTGAVMGAIALVVMLWDLCRDLGVYQRASRNAFFPLLSLIVGSALAGIVTTNILELAATVLP